MIGEIGGNAEETAAEFVKSHMKKPVVGFIAGQTAASGTPHGARRARSFSGGKGNGRRKDQRRWRHAEFAWPKSPAAIGETLAAAIGVSV